MNAPKRKSANTIAEERMIAAEIAKADYFTVSLILGPHDRHKVAQIPNYESAKVAADMLNKLSKFGRKSIIYAVTKLGSFPCDDALVALARSL